MSNLTDGEVRKAPTQKKCKRVLHVWICLRVCLIIQLRPVIPPTVDANSSQTMPAINSSIPLCFLLLFGLAQKSWGLGEMRCICCIRQFRLFPLYQVNVNTHWSSFILQAQTSPRRRALMRIGTAGFYKSFPWLPIHPPTNLESEKEM